MKKKLFKKTKQLFEELSDFIRLLIKKISRTLKVYFFKFILYFYSIFKKQLNFNLNEDITESKLAEYFFFYSSRIEEIEHKFFNPEFKEIFKEAHYNPEDKLNLYTITFLNSYKYIYLCPQSFVKLNEYPLCYDKNKKVLKQNFHINKMHIKNMNYISIRIFENKEIMKGYYGIQIGMENVGRNFTRTLNFRFPSVFYAFILKENFSDFISNFEDNYLENSQLQKCIKNF